MRKYFTNFKMSSFKQFNVPSIKRRPEYRIERIA